MKDPIQEALPFHTDKEPKGVQVAWKATINILVPCVDKNGEPVSNLAEAQDYVSETLRGLFLDWGYVKADLGTKQPDGGLRPIVVLQPYIEGTFENKEPTVVERKR